MTTLEEILEINMGCDMPFCGDGSLSFEGEEAVEKILELLRDLASCGIIPNVSEQAEKQIAEITSQPRSNKEQMIFELHNFVLHGDVNYVLETPVLVTTKNGEKYLAKYFSRDIDYADIFCMDNECDEGEDYKGNIYDMQNLTDESVMALYEAIKTQEINNGWDWQEHAHKVLRKKFPDAGSHNINDFVMEHWQNLCTDEFNTSEFADWMED